MPQVAFLSGQVCFSTIFHKGKRERERVCTAWAQTEGELRFSVALSDKLPNKQIGNQQKACTTRRVTKREMETQCVRERSSAKLLPIANRRRTNTENYVAPETRRDKSEFCSASWACRWSWSCSCSWTSSWIRERSGRREHTYGYAWQITAWKSKAEIEVPNKISATKSAKNQRRQLPTRVGTPRNPLSGLLSPSLSLYSLIIRTLKEI